MPLTRADLLTHMKDLALRLDSAAFGERSRLIDEAAEQLALSVQSVYRYLKRVGWVSGRKVRSDKGTTSQDSEGLAFVATVQKTSVRQNGKVTMTIPTAVSIAAQNGVAVNVGAARMASLLRERGLDVRSQARASSHVSMRSLHPNHVHQVDASLCLVYYLNGQQLVIRDDQLYKNKLSTLARVKFKCYRWVLTDHASSVIVPWYTEAAGEDQFSLAEFLLFAWGQQESRPFHGVPRIVVWDKGSANQAHAVGALLRSLEVESIAHAVGNSRAKGQVECAHNLVEKEFESRLRLEPVETVAQLNAAAFAWANAYNANQVPQQDTRVHRGPIHVARYDLWMRIKEAELRYLPEADQCRALLAGRELQRKVMPGLQITFKHPASEVALRYDVRHLEGVSVGDMLTVQPMLYGDCAVLASIESYKGERREWKLAPVRDYDAYGFRDSSPVFGESFKSNPQTLVEASGKALDRMAYGERPEEEIARAKQKNEAPFEGLVDAHSHLAKVVTPTYLPRRGSEISVPDRVSVGAPAPMTRLAACKALVQILGRPLTLEDNRKVAVWYPDGVPEQDLAHIAVALRTGATPFRNSGAKEASA